MPGCWRCIVTQGHVCACGWLCLVVWVACYSGERPTPVQRFVNGWASSGYWTVVCCSAGRVGILTPHGLGVYPSHPPRSGIYPPEGPRRAPPECLDQGRVPQAVVACHTGDGLGWIGRPSRPGWPGGYMSQVWELAPQSAPMGTPSQCPGLGPGDPAIHRATPAALGQGWGIGRPLLSLASWMGCDAVVYGRRMVCVYMIDRPSTDYQWMFDIRSIDLRCMFDGIR